MTAEPEAGAAGEAATVPAEVAHFLVRLASKAHLGAPSEGETPAGGLGSCSMVTAPGEGVTRSYAGAGS